MENCGSSSLIAVIPAYRNSIVIMQRFRQHPFGGGKAVEHCTGQENENHHFLGRSLPPAPHFVGGGGEKAVDHTSFWVWPKAERSAKYIKVQCQLCCIFFAVTGDKDFFKKKKQQNNPTTSCSRLYLRHRIEVIPLEICDL